jgi:DNA-directed RNA polymerase specialized sigma24 family protein
LVSIIDPTLDWQEMQDWSLSDLIEAVKMRDDEDSIAWSKAAFVNIVFKLRKDVLQKCTIMCIKAGLTETDAEELTNRVFERFYKYPTQYGKKPSRCKTVESALKVYLYGIATNELYDMVHPDESPYDGTEEVVTSLIDPEEEYEPEVLAQLQEAEASINKALSHLSPKHKIIYLTYRYHERKGRYLPARLRKKLVDALGGISINTIRVYKMQAIEAMKNLTSDGKK